jgi:hypothetical protein
MRVMKVVITFESEAVVDEVAGTVATMVDQVVDPATNDFVNPTAFNGCVSLRRPLNSTLFQEVSSPFTSWNASIIFVR